MPTIGINMKRVVWLLLGCISIASDVIAEEQSFMSAIEEGKANLSLRARYEDVNIPKQGAQALTLRSRLTYQTKSYHLFSALIEFDDVTAIPDDENYFTGVNGQTDDAVIQDAEGTELNRAWLAYDIANTLFKYGRQNVSLDNERFFGKDAWRQNEQTFSGLSAFNESLNYLRIRLAQLNQVEGVEGESNKIGKRDLNAQLVNIEYRGFPNSQLAIYGYWIESDYLDNQEDTVSYGARFSGHIKNSPEIDYAFEYALQKDRDDNLIDYSAAYSLMEFGVRYNGVRVGVGQEVLGADGEGYFVTPLASLHEFQGWTDQFQNQGLGNIEGGIQDRFMSVGYACSDYFHVNAMYHEFKSEGQGFGDLGSEWGVEVEGDINHYNVKLKYAEYSRDNYGVDTDKVWVSIGAKF